MNNIEQKLEEQAKKITRLENRLDTLTSLNENFGPLCRTITNEIKNLPQDSQQRITTAIENATH